MAVEWLDGIAQAPSGNHGGTFAPRLIVMHYTAAKSAAGAIAWLRTPASKVSAHFVIAMDGTTTQLVACNKIAWHAGASAWTCADGAKLSGLNMYALGIELDYDGPVARVNGKFYGRRVYAPEDVVTAAHKNDPTHKQLYWPKYPPAQIAAAVGLVRRLRALGAVPPACELVGHDDIAPGRKSDPGPAFDWDAFHAACG